MKRAGFTMIELIFVIVILGVLAAVAIPKLSGVRDDAILANANENFCVNLKGQYLNRTMRSDSLAGLDLDNLIDLPTGFTFVNGTANASGENSILVANGSLNGRTTAAASMSPAIQNVNQSIYVFFVDGNSTDGYGCFIGSTATSTRSAAEALTRMNNGQGNYL